MIAKLMKGNDFEGVLRYALSKPEAEIIGGSVFHNPYSKSVSLSDRLSAKFQLTRALRPTVKNPVSHTAISFGHQEKISNALFVELADEFLSRMGWDLKKTQAIYIRHHDTAHPHLHIIASRIQLDTELVPERNDCHRAIAICRELEEKYNLHRVNAPASIFRSATKNEREILKRKKKPSIKMQLQLAIATAAQKTHVVGEFVEQLEALGVGVLPAVDEKGNVRGIIYRLEDVKVCGYKLGKGCSWPGLQKHLGLTYDPQRDAPRLRAAGEREIARAIETFAKLSTPGSHAAVALHRRGSNAGTGSTGESTGGGATGDGPGDGTQLPMLLKLECEPGLASLRPQEPNNAKRGATAGKQKGSASGGRRDSLDLEYEQFDIQGRTGSESDKLINASDESRFPQQHHKQLRDGVITGTVGKPGRINKRAKSQSDRLSSAAGATGLSNRAFGQLALDFGERQSHVGDERRPDSQPLTERGDRREQMLPDSEQPGVEFDSISGAAVEPVPDQHGDSNSSNPAAATADDTGVQNHNTQRSGASRRERVRAGVEAITGETRNLEPERSFRHEAADLKPGPESKRASDERVASTQGEPEESGGDGITDRIASTRSTQPVAGNQLQGRAFPTHSGGYGATTVQPDTGAAQDLCDGSSHPSEPRTGIAPVSFSESHTGLDFTTTPDSTRATESFEQGRDGDSSLQSESAGQCLLQQTTPTPQPNSQLSQTLKSTDDSAAVDTALVTGSELRTARVGGRGAGDYIHASGSPFSIADHAPAVDGDIPTSGSVAQEVGRATEPTEVPPPTVEEQRGYYDKLYSSYLSQTQSKTDAAVAVKALSVGHQPDEVARILTQSPTVQAFPDKQQQIEYIERTYKQAYEGFKQLKADLSRTNTLKGLER